MVFEKDCLLKSFKLKAFQTRDEAVEYRKRHPESGGHKNEVFAMDIHRSGKKCFIVATLDEF